MLKALGLTLQHNLKWNTHVNTIIKRVNLKLSMLKKVAKNLNSDQFLKVATAQLFSIMYYAGPVWLNGTLTSDLWKKLRALHYRILGAAKKDYKKVVSKDTLNREYKRATPRMWSDYSAAALAIKILRDRSPIHLYEHLTLNLYFERRRPFNGKFYNTSAGKIGRHKFHNRLESLSMIDQPWHGKDLSDDAICVMLKKHLNFDLN